MPRVDHEYYKTIGIWKETDIIVGKYRLYS